MNQNPLVKLELENFRCFAEHTVNFSHLSLLVGKNNAGKSTCVEALRLVSLVTERQQGLQFRTPPDDLVLPRYWKGLQPGLEAISIRRDLVFNHYGDPPAKITAHFASGSRIEMHIGKSLKPHAVIFNSGGRLVSNREEFIQAQIPRISILPQIGPLLLEETLLTLPYVRANLYTARSSLHFRNQLHFLGESYEEFAERVAVTWPKLRLQGLNVPLITNREDSLALFVRDNDFVAEVASMGHGLQMWLQIIWFLVRSSTSATVILDEPDVYMHADLQRRLIRMMLQDERQCIIATHSPEMLAEVEPESVVVLDRTQQSSKPATDSKAVQELLASVGSVHNLDLARLGNFGRLLLVEGEDVGLLKLFQNVVDPHAALPIDAIPSASIGGWSNWMSVQLISELFRKNTPNQICVYCLLDRDYRTDEDLEKRRLEAERTGVVLQIWSGKEIENYALMPGPIARLITKDSGRNVTSEQVETQINAIVDSLREVTVDRYSEVIRQREKKIGADVSNPRARKLVAILWEELGGAMVVNGKEVFSKLSDWAQSDFQSSISVRRVIRSARESEVPQEVKDFLEKITASGPNRGLASTINTAT